MCKIQIYANTRRIVGNVVKQDIGIQALRHMLPTIVVGVPNCIHGPVSGCSIYCILRL